MTRMNGTLEALHSENEALRQRVSALEQQVQTLEERLSLVQEVGDFGIWEWDISLDNLTWSPTLERHMGLEPDTFDGTFASYLACLHPDDQETLKRTIQELLARRSYAYHLEQRIICPDGSIHWMESRARVLYDEAEQPVRLVGVGQVITERKQVEETLRATSQRLEEVFETTSLASVEIDLDGRITRWNPSAKRIFGWSAEEALGKELLPLVVPPHIMAHVEGVLKSLLQGEIANSQNENVTKDGRIITCRWSNTMIRDESGRVVGVMAQAEDVTEQVQLEQERMALQQQIIDAQRVALHELSTPLIPIFEDIVVMPLIGAIDTARAQQVMETLLEGIAHHQAETAILDITGVQVVDTQVANALVRAARAAKLLGAQVILTGIQPQIAHTLVTLGSDLRSIITCSTLQAGITYAMAQKNNGQSQHREAINSFNILP